MNHLLSFQKHFVLIISLSFSGFGKLITLVHTQQMCGAGAFPDYRKRKRCVAMELGLDSGNHAQ
jgi:hypothetical protein